MGNVIATARIQVVVDMPAGTWDGETSPLPKIMEHCKKESINNLRNILGRYDGRVVGEPTVKLVMVEEQR